jgi:hypothetical protein
LHRVHAVGFDAVAGRLGYQGGGDDPAVVAFFGEILVESGATGTGFIDKDQMLGLGWYLADENEFPYVLTFRWWENSCSLILKLLRSRRRCSGPDASLLNFA